MSVKSQKQHALRFAEIYLEEVVLSVQSVERLRDHVLERMERDRALLAEAEEKMTELTNLKREAQRVVDEKRREVDENSTQENAGASDNDHDQ